MSNSDERDYDEEFYNAMMMQDECEPALAQCDGCRMQKLNCECN